MKRTPIEEKPNKKAKKKRSKAVNIVSIIILVIAMGVFCFAGYKLLTIAINYKTASNTYGDIQEIVQPNKPATTKETTIPETNAEGETYDPNDIDTDFVWDYPALLKINPDCVGWIKMRGTGTFLVNYPVVLTTNNTYYLDHLFDNTYNPSGAIFMDFAAINKFESQYTFLYGHNMAQGSRMFGYLKQYESASFFNAHREMDIYTEDKHYVYKVFATYIEYDTGLTYTSQAQFIDETWTEAEKNERITEIVKYALEKSQHKCEVTIKDFNIDSHILVLSTCYGNNSDPRKYIVMLLRDREIPIEPNLPIAE